jgi:hypothetical protein
MMENPLLTQESEVEVVEDLALVEDDGLDEEEKPLLTQGGVVQIFSNCAFNFAGTNILYSGGTYTTQQLINMLLPGGIVRGITVPAGLSVQIFTQDYFLG